MFRASRVFAAWVGLWAMVWIAICVHAISAQPRAAGRLAREALMVEACGLTDLCLFTEARYTRHLAVADYWTAFQDHPTALEHFPSGSLVAPPPHLMERSHAR